MSKKPSLKGPGGSQNQKKSSTHNNSQSSSDQLKFPCETAQNGKCLISIFQEFSSSINKTLILARRLCTRLSFYEI